MEWTRKVIAVLKWVDHRSAIERAVAASIITRAQADAMIALEETSAVARRRASAVPPVLEALGYLGAIFVMVGAVTLVSGFWDNLATWSRLCTLGLAAGALTGVGIMVDDSGDRVLWRLRGFILLLATGAIAGFAGVLTVDALNVRGPAAVLIVGGAVASHSGLLWALKDRPAQLGATLGGAVAAVVGGVTWLGAGAGVVGLALWLVGAAWLAASLRRAVVPALVPKVLGAALLLASAGVITGEWRHAGILCGLATAGGLVALGISCDEALLTAAGVVGAFVYLPATLGVFFGETIGVPAVMLVSGLALLALTAVLLRRRLPDRAPVGRSWRPHRPRPI